MLDSVREQLEMMNQLILRPVIFAHNELDFLFISSMFSKGREGDGS